MPCPLSFPRSACPGGHCAETAPGSQGASRGRTVSQQPARQLRAGGLCSLCLRRGGPVVTASEGDAVPRFRRCTLSTETELTRSTGRLTCNVLGIKPMV